MKTFLFFTFALFSQQAISAEPISIFNGGDLSGWNVFVDQNEVSASDAWHVEGGLLRCTGKGRGYIRSELAYADYVLRLEWRWPQGAFDGRANSGVLLHVVGVDQLWPKSFEAQLKTTRAGEFASFEDARSDNEIVSRNPGGKSTGRLPLKVASAEKPIGEWNAYEITARGDELVIKVNGVEVNRMAGVLPSAGQIALQSEGYPIDFRNLTVEMLPAAKDLHAPMPKKN